MKCLLILAIFLNVNFAIASNGQDCPSKNNEVKMMAVGDIIFHGALLVQAMTENKGFESLWKPVLPLMEQADLLYGNLEGPAAAKINDRGQFDPNAGDAYDPAGNIYSPGTEGKAYSFNFHPDSVRALKGAGFEVLSLANNHSADRRSKGIDSTIELFEELGILGYGTKHSQKSANWYQVINKNGIQIGFIGCTYGTNTGTNADQILMCYRGNESNPALIELIKELKNKVDIIILTPHWGNEYSFQTDTKQRRLTQDALRAGVRIILGHHPHVLQPLDVQEDENKNIKSIVAYSLGNWVTNQQPYDYKDQSKHMRFFAQRISYMLFFELEKQSSDIVIKSPKIVPTYMAAKHETGFNGRALYPAYPELYPKNATLRNKIRTAQQYVEVGNPFDVPSEIKLDHYKDVRPSYLKYKLPAEHLNSIFCGDNL